MLSSVGINANAKPNPNTPIATVLNQKLGSNSDDKIIDGPTRRNATQKISWPIPIIEKLFCLSLVNQPIIGEKTTTKNVRRKKSMLTWTGVTPSERKCGSSVGSMKATANYNKESICRNNNINEIA
jgi:hypothetical protein